MKLKVYDEGDADGDGGRVKGEKGGGHKKCTERGKGEGGVGGESEIKEADGRCELYILYIVPNAHRNRTFSLSLSLSPPCVWQLQPRTSNDSVAKKKVNKEKHGATF